MASALRRSNIDLSAHGRRPPDILQLCHRPSLIVRNRRAQGPIRDRRHSLLNALAWSLVVRDEGERNGMRNTQMGSGGSGVYALIQSWASCAVPMRRKRNYVYTVCDGMVRCDALRDDT